MNLFFVSLGCDKNLVDSEKMIALLASQNISVTSTPEDAEIINCEYLWLLFWMQKRKVLRQFLKWQNTKRPASVSRSL